MRGDATPPARGARLAVVLDPTRLRVRGMAISWGCAVRAGAEAERVFRVTARRRRDRPGSSGRDNVKKM